MFKKYLLESILHEDNEDDEEYEDKDEEKEEFDDEEFIDWMRRKFRAREYKTGTKLRIFELKESYDEVEESIYSYLSGFDDNLNVDGGDNERWITGEDINLRYWAFDGVNDAGECMLIFHNL